MHLWNTTTGQQVFAYRSRFSTGEVLAVAWSPDGTYLAAGNNVGIGQVWDTTAHTLVAGVWYTCGMLPRASRSGCFISSDVQLGPSHNQDESQVRKSMFRLAV